MNSKIHVRNFCIFMLGAFLIGLVGAVIGQSLGFDLRWWHAGFLGGLYGLLYPSRGRYGWLA